MTPSKALVINFNRWPATPVRSEAIFLRVNGATREAASPSPARRWGQMMGWITPGSHPRIAIG
ncbi:hypothetical protein [Streptomyces sp. NPDC001401]|uniref:hypothetical protein n=1 Tax=Streptomyces sp. NPDC001401 TaxID=3364570 RepID=UPI0036D17D35